MTTKKLTIIDFKEKKENSQLSVCENRRRERKEAILK